MKKRGQTIKLKHNATGHRIEAKVVLADSKQGYLAELLNNPCCGFLDAWHWYNLQEWSEV